MRRPSDHDVLVATDDPLPQSRTRTHVAYWVTSGTFMYVWPMCLPANTTPCARLFEVTR